MATFVIFGNHDQKFKRMATAINNLFFLLPKPVIIQAGVNTSFFNLSNEGLIIFEKCSYTDFTKYISESDLIITHGGVGALKESILLDFYPAVFVRQGVQKEHVDDHQVDWCNLIFSKGSFFLNSSLSSSVKY